MIPVYQSKFSRNGDKGNCWAACLASILELPVREIPDTSDISKGHWIDQTEQFLLAKGWKLTHCDVDRCEGWGIAIGNSPRGTAAGHAIVTFDGKPFHDPHPDGTMLKGSPWNQFRIHLQPTVQSLHTP